MSFPPSYDIKKFFEELNERIDKPIEFNHLLSKFVNEIAAAQVFVVGDLLFFNDPVRGRPVSVTRSIFTGGYYGLNQSSRYLRVDGVTTAGSHGIIMPRNGIITAMTAKSRSIGAWTFEVRRNGVPITLAGIPVVSSVGNNPLLDVDFDAGDFLQFYLSGSGVDHPIVSLEVAWR
jgi:hypothetical protein